MTEIPALLLFASSFNLGYIQVPGEGWNAPDPGASYTPFAAESLDMTCFGVVQDTSYGIQGFDVSEDGDWVYAVAYDTSYCLIIYDVSDSTNPFEVNRIRLNQKLPKENNGSAEVAPLANNVSTCLLDDTLLYAVHADDYRFRVFNLSDPPNPVYVSQADSAVTATEMLQIGNIVYCVRNGNYRFILVDVSDPYNPERIRFEAPGLAADQVDLFYSPSSAPDYLFVMRSFTTSGRADTYIYSYDVSDPANPQLVDTIHFWITMSPGYEDFFATRSIVVDMDTMSGKSFLWALSKAIVCYEITDIHNPDYLWWWNSGYDHYGSDVHQDRAYVANPLGILVYNLTTNMSGWQNPIAYYQFDDVPTTFEKSIWCDNKVFATTSELAFGLEDTIKRLGIFHYFGDSGLPDTGDRYFDWVRTVYGPPGLEFSLKEQTGVSFFLFNVAGQKAYEQDLGILEAGPHIVALPLLGPGVYFLSLKTNETTFNTKIVFTRP